jgi:hypothetical protein
MGFNTSVTDTGTTSSLVRPSSLCISAIGASDTQANATNGFSSSGGLEVGGGSTTTLDILQQIVISQNAQNSGTALTYNQNWEGIMVTFGLASPINPSSPTITGTSANAQSTVSISWTDSTGTLAYYRVGSNATGTFTNSTWTAFSLNNQTNFVIQNPGYIVSVQYQIWVNDSNGVQMSMKSTYQLTNLFWSGYTWNIKNVAIQGPNLNAWSNSPQNVWVDTSGYLHLSLTYVNGIWYCAELDNTANLG